MLAVGAAALGAVAGLIGSISVGTIGGTTTAPTDLAGNRLPAATEAARNVLAAAGLMLSLGAGGGAWLMLRRPLLGGALLSACGVAILAGIAIARPGGVPVALWLFPALALFSGITGIAAGERSDPAPQPLRGPPRR